MRINAGSKITARTVENAAMLARQAGHDIYIHDMATSPRGAITFYAYSANGTRATNRNDGCKAASWSAWGYLIAALYVHDPTARIAHYNSAHHFFTLCEEEAERCATYRGEVKDVSFLDLLRMAYPDGVPTTYRAVRAANERRHAME